MAIESLALQVLTRIVESTTVGATVTSHTHSVMVPLTTSIEGLSSVYSAQWETATSVTLDAVTDACGNALDMSGAKLRHFALQAPAANVTVVDFAGTFHGDTFAGQLWPGSVYSVTFPQHASQAVIDSTFGVATTSADANSVINVLALA